MPQVKVGWRSGAVAAPSVSTILLDTYSGAAAAYSLRKLSSTYTGSAIRVRRSSDNTEQNIGFDSDGNLDTYALSAFVGSGNGFVTIWYDQSVNGNNATQTTASSQPQIVSDGSILTTNGKPSIKLDGVDDLLFLSSTIFTNTSNYHSFVGKRAASGDRLYGLAGDGSYNYALGLWTGNNYLLQAKTGYYQLSNSTDTTTNQLLITGKNVSGTMSIYKNNTIIPSTQFSAGIAPNINNIGRAINTFFPAKCSLQEIVFYNNDQTSNQTGIESNINTYYSVYPNPTSVWNLLAAAYNADSIGSSSLKTSLFAAYNGESNVNDSFGANNGTAVGGLTYTAGKIGNAFQFNGTTSYVNVSNSSGQFNFTGDFTVSAWINVPGYSKNQFIFCNYAAGSTYGYGWNFYLPTLNKFQFELVNGSVIGQYTTTSGIATNTWNHVVAVRKVGQDPKIYLNGVLLSGGFTLGNSSISPTYTGSTLCKIGAITAGATTYYSDNKQDATTIWQKALTQSEITELYNSGNGAQYIVDNFYKPTPNDALNTYNGTAQGGLTYEVGKVGTAFKFNGSNSLVELPTNSMKFTGDFSYSFWVNFASLGGYPSLISNYRNAAGSDYGYFLRMNPSNKLEFWGFATSTNSFAMVSVTTFNTNTWYHVSVTKSSSSVKIYVNGALDRTNSVGVPITYFSTMYPAIGCLYKWNGSLSADFVSNGSKIDAVGIWNKELTATEVTELYNSGNGKQYPN